MEVVILCGGKGIRLLPLSEDRPKPMVEIGSTPILEHIMGIYSHWGFDDFTLLLGYKGGIIMDYFAEKHPDWNIKFRFTGVNSETSERLWKVRNKLPNAFFLTYGDVLADINLDKELLFHKNSGKAGTMTIVPLQCPYGTVKFDKKHIMTEYLEKPVVKNIWINGGFMIFEPTVFDYMSKTNKDFSKDVLPRLSEERQLACYRHNGFWRGMDTYKDHTVLNSLWNSGKASWAVWKKK